MKLNRETFCVVLLLLTSSAYATTTVIKQIDSIKNTSGGSSLSVPSTGTTIATDTNSITLQNKVIDGGSSITTAANTVDATDNTKQLAWSLSGMTTAKTLTFSLTQSTTQTLAVPNVGAADTLATRLATQTFGSGSTWNGVAIGVGFGGTALTATPTNGQLAIGNGTNYTLGTIGSGHAITVTNGSGTISVAANIGANQEQDIFYGNGSTTAFVLSITPAGAISAVTCALDGATITPGPDYTFATATVTMLTAPATGQRLFCFYNQY